MRVLCVPSKTENFGMTVAEALIAQTPVICTKTAPWEELNTRHCGWWVDNDIDTLAQTIREALLLPQSEIDKMGEDETTLRMDINWWRETGVCIRMNTNSGG